MKWDGKQEHIADSRETGQPLGSTLKKTTV